MCGSLKGKLFHATKENTELKQEVAYLTARLEKTKLSDKMIDDDLSRVEESATTSTYKLGVVFERCDVKGEKSAPMFFLAPTTTKRRKHSYQPKTHYPSNPKREVRKETTKPREDAFVCMFCGRAGHLDEFCFWHKKSGRGTLILLETHIVMCSLICRLILILVFRLVLTVVLHLADLLVLCLVSLIDLTIAHMILFHKRTTLCLDVLVTAHVLIVLIVPHVGMVFILESLTLTLSPNTWTFHIFPVVVHVPLI
jgi:hypothetical protein